MSKKISVELKNDLTEIVRMSQIIDEFCASNKLPPDTVFALNLSLEEILANVIAYGYDDHNEHVINVRMNLHQGQVYIEVEDDGKPFNPLEVDAPDIDKPLEERPIGGLGIHLVKNHMDSLQYKRKDERNLLIMKKKANPN
ncbi:MAG TPA: ATP-binding protein [Thermodesulfobacteriota bacterium]|jgi:anti-sigma regulatory factor (Ser/Thr protein kinase)